MKKQNSIIWTDSLYYLVDKLVKLMTGTHAPIALRIRKHQNWSPRPLRPQDVQSIQSPREHLHIQIQVYLRRRQSVLLKTPRWSDPHLFWRRALEGIPEVCELSPPSPHLSRTLQWRQLLEQFGFIASDEPVLKVVAERGGFRQALMHVMVAQQSPILIAQAERWPLTMLADIQFAWHKTKEPKRPALLISGAIRGGEVNHQLWLPDLSLDESMRILMKNRHTADDLTDLTVYLRRSGGVPAFVEALEPLVTSKRMSKSAVEHVWQSLLSETQDVVDHLSTDMKPYMRLCAIVQSGALPFIYGVDQPLIETGLVRKVRRGMKSFIVLRAPLFARCIGPL